MNLEELRSRYKPQILALADQFGVENIRVFGSTARGDAKPDSDVDFLVSIRPGTTLVDLGGLLWRLENLMNTKVDIVSDRKINKHLREFILAEATPI